MNALQEDAVSTLRELISICRDGQEGFRNASEHIVDDPDLKKLLSSYSLQRAKFAGDLESQMITLGEHHPELEDGSITAAAHRGWLNLKSVLHTNNNQSILKECERGEDVALEAYNKALSHHLPEPVHELVQEQRHEIAATHNTLRSLRDGKPNAVAEALAAAESRTMEHAERAQAEAGAAWGHVKASADKARKDAESYIRKNPFPTLLGALLTGFSIGLIFYAFDLRNERMRIEAKRQRTPLKRFRTGLAGALGYLAGQARSVSSSASDAVREYGGRASLVSQRKQGNRFTRPLLSAWNRIARRQHSGTVFIGRSLQR